MRGAPSDDDSAHSSGDEGLAELTGLSAEDWTGAAACDGGGGGASASNPAAPPPPPTARQRPSFAAAAAPRCSWGDGAAPFTSHPTSPGFLLADAAINISSSSSGSADGSGSGGAVVPPPPPPPPLLLLLLLPEAPVKRMPVVAAC